MDMERTEVANEMMAVETKKSMRNAGIFFFLVMVMEIPMAVLVGAVSSFFPEKYAFVISILMTQGYFLICGIVYMLVTKTKFSRDLKMQKFKISTFFLSLVVLITAAPMSTWLNVFSQLFAENEMAGNIFEMTEVLPAVLGVLLVGCLPGFIEELLYRGIMFSAFRKRSILTGVIISALSFGLMHMNFNQIMYAIYLGLVFALLVEATGSLCSSMILHMLFNAMNTLYLYILPVMYEFLGRYSPEYANVDLNEMMSQTVTKPELLVMLVVITPFAIGGFVLTILLLKLIAKMNGRSFTWATLRGEKAEVKKTRPVNVFVILGWAFCLFMAVFNLVVSKLM